MQTAQVAPVASPEKLEMDAARMQQFQRKMREEQDLSRGAFASLGAAALGACLWALVTVLTQFQIGWMAVGVGFMVGYAMRTFGRGIDKVFGYTAAIMALLGCLAGNLLSVCIVLADQTDTSAMAILTGLDFSAITGLMMSTFQPMDLIFYGLALYEGYRFSFRKLSDKEVRALMA